MAYDGPWVFRAPYGNEAALENFQNTVLGGISEERARQFTDDPPESGGSVRLWGTSPSNDGTWQQVDADDYLIFYRDGTYTHAAQVVSTEINDALAREVWPNFDEEPWDRIMFLRMPTELDVPAAELHDLTAIGREHVMGFNSFNDLGVGAIRGKYGSIEAFAEGHGGTTALADEAVHVEPEFDLDTSILDGLYFPDGRDEELIEQVESAFAAGKHVVFTGPPGTGKTELARRICGSLVEQHGDVYTGFQTTTATADWSTFETVGGYMPAESDDDLTFEPGQVLRRFKRDGEQRNELLVIDEINRADIDKAFGQLFTLLSGQAVQLPYRRDGNEIAIEPGTEETGAPAAHEYVMPRSWRLVATMNTYDKTSLYELSYAFMRRFSFVHVDAPDLSGDRGDAEALVRRYAAAWDVDPDDDTVAAVAEIWQVLNGGDSARKIGPAIVEDLLRGIEHGPHRDHERAVTAAVGNYVLPQLEGVQDRDRTVRAIATVDHIDQARLADLAEDVLRVTIDG